MGKSELVYYPYHSAQYVFLLAVVIAVVLSFLSGFTFTMPENLTGAVICLCLGIVMLCCAYYAYTFSRILVIIQESGIETIHKRKSQCKFYPWDKFSYSYHCRSYKGFNHLVLSSVILDDKQLRKMANESLNLGKLCIDNCLILSLDQGHKSEILESFIKDRIKGQNGEDKTV